MGLMDYHDWENHGNHRIKEITVQTKNQKTLPLVVVRPRERRLRPAAEGRVQLVAEAVAEEVARHDYQGNCHAREQHCPPSLVHVVAGVGQHAAPRRSGRANADGKEGQSGLQQDEPPQLVARHHQDGGDGVGQDVAEDDADVVGAQSPRRGHILPFADGQGLAAGDAGELHPSSYPHYQDQALHVGADQRRPYDGDEDVGKAEEYVHDAHGDAVGPAAAEPCYEADGHSHDRAQEEAMFDVLPLSRGISQCSGTSPSQATPEDL